MRLLRVIAGMQVLCVLLSSSGSHASTRSRIDAQSETIQLMVEGREKVIGYVRDIKAKYKEDTPEYGEAKKKYREALGKYSGWAIAVKTAIRDGKAKDLGKDKSYKNMADSAGRASKEFIEYVEAKTASSKGLFPFLKDLADLGLKVWNGYKDRQQQERTFKANEFEKDVKWPQWEDIKVQ